jgi:hypothetical protein
MGNQISLGPDGRRGDTPRFVIGAPPIGVGARASLAILPAIFLGMVAMVARLVRLSYGARTGVAIGAALVILVLMLAIPLYVVLSRQNSRILLFGDRLVVRDALGRERSFATSQIHRVLYRSMRVGQTSRPLVLVLDESSRLLIRWPARGWFAEQLEELWRLLRIEPERSASAVPPRELQEAVPGSVGFAPLHSGVLTAAFLATLVAFSVAVVALGR